MDGQQPNAQQGLSQQQIQQMQLVVKQALGELLQDDTADMLVKQAQQGNPQEIVARAIGPLLQAVYQSAADAGQNLDMVTVLAAGVQVIGVVGEMLVKAGVIPEQELPSFCAAVAKMAVDQHNAAQGGQGAPA
jgi:hypothetical protein